MAWTEIDKAGKKTIKTKTVLIAVLVTVGVVCCVALILGLTLGLLLNRGCSLDAVTCDATSRYRTIDGSCNNLNYPHDGQAMRPYFRLLKPAYGGRDGSPRVAKNGNALPNARKVSIELFQDVANLSGVHTGMVMTFGQLVDHDTDHTPKAIVTNADGTTNDPTCGTSGCTVDDGDNSECWPITIPAGDPTFTKECLKFFRSRKYCDHGTREQFNSITSWVDASFLYGSKTVLASSLRDTTDSTRGKMKVLNNPVNATQKPFLPLGTDAGCRNLSSLVQCFVTGDVRSNVQVGLIALHTVFVRIHNHFEEQLFSVNPSWGGEKLYQETRKLVIAVWQNMVYYEYLPIILGPEFLTKYQLGTKSTAFTGYESMSEGQGDIFNAFSTAAFRFGHSQITDTLRFTDTSFSTNFDVDFSAAFFRPWLIYESPIAGTSGIDAVVLGMANQRDEHTDRFFSTQVTTKLFAENPPTGLGSDLPALNTQRGRDHGLPSYNKFREWCGLYVATSFFELIDIPIATRDKFIRLYEHVDDIDLFAGGIAEDSVVGGQVGPTFACLIGYQFRNLKVADRFWFENSGTNVGFTTAQIQNIHDFTFSKLLCITGDDITTIQKFNMLVPISEAMTNLNTNMTSEIYSYASLYQGSNNERVACSSLSDINYSIFTG